MAEKTIIDVEARFIDHVSSGTGKAKQSIDELGKKSKEAGKELDNVGKKKASPKVDVDDSRGISKLNKLESKLKSLGHTKAAARLESIDNATRKITAVTKSALAFGKRNFEARLGIKDSDGAMTRLRKVSDAGRKIHGKVWKGVVKVADYATAPLRKITNMLFNVKTLIAGIVAGAAFNKAIVQPVNLSDTIESSRIAFETKLGSAQKAEKFLQGIYKFDEKSPFDTIQIVGLSQQMMNMGWQAENVLGDLGRIGDWAAAMGKGEKGIGRVTLALGQMRQKGKLSAEEMLQLTEAGVSGWDYLAKYFNTTIPNVRKMAEKGEIDVNKAIQGIMSGMEEFAGAAEKNSDRTVKGILGQLDSLVQTKLILPWGDGLASGLKEGLGEVKGLLDKYKGTFEKWGQGLKEIGASASKWFADKISNAIEKVEAITARADFKNADFGGKVKILWGEMIAEPFSNWWNTKVFDSIVNIALEIGKAIAQAIGKGIKIAFQSHPILTSLVVGKMLGLDSLLAGGVSTLGAMAGKRIIGSAGSAVVKGTGISGKLAGVGYALNGGAATSTLTGGKAAILGGAAITGGLVAGAGLIHAGKTGYEAYKGFKEGDKTRGWANTARSGITIAGLGAGIGTGAAIGASVGSVGCPAGALIGAGLGTVVGWFAGEKIARNIEAAKYETKEMKDAIKDADKSAEELAETFNQEVYKNMERHMGDIKLSAEEISRLANQVVWGDDFGSFDKFTKATDAANDSLASLKSAAEQTNRWMWKASLGVKFNADEKTSIKQSFDEYIQSAKSYVENSHYQFTATVSMLVDVQSEEGKSILSSGNALYQKLEKDLDSLGGKLSKTVDIALQDGVITLDEQAEIDRLQQQIAEITEKLSSAEEKADLKLIKVKFGGGNLDMDSFENLMETMDKTIQERVKGADEAFTIAVSRIELELAEGSIDKDEYNRQLKAITEGYTAKIEGMRAEVMDVELDIMGDAYSDVLGSKAKEKLKSGLEESLKQGIDPVDWTEEDAKKFLGVDDLSGETAKAIGTMLSGLSSQLKLLEVDGKIYTAWEVENKEDPAEKIRAAIGEATIENIQKKVGIDITGEPEILNTIAVLASDFGIPTEQAAYIALMLSGNKQILNHIDVFAEEFGISPEVAKTIIARLFGQKQIANTLFVNAGEFGIPPDIAEILGIELTPKKKINGTVGPLSGKDFGVPPEIVQSVVVRLTPTKLVDKMLHSENSFRGGIVGPNGPVGFSNGGMVHGGPQLVTVAEEGSPEMIIPLSSQRRERGRKLWEKAGHMLRVPGFAQGGIVGTDTRLNKAEGQPNAYTLHARKEATYPKLKGVDRDQVHADQMLYSFEKIRMIGSGTGLNDAEGQTTDFIPQGRADRLYNGFGRNGMDRSNQSQKEPTSRDSEKEFSPIVSGGETHIQLDIGGITIQVEATGTNGDILTAIRESKEAIAEEVAGVVVSALKNQFSNTPTRGSA